MCVTRDRCLAPVSCTNVGPNNSGKGRCRVRRSFVARVVNIFGRPRFYVSDERRSIRPRYSRIEFRWFHRIVDVAMVERRIHRLYIETLGLPHGRSDSSSSAIIERLTGRPFALRRNEEQESRVRRFELLAILRAACKRRPRAIGQTRGESCERFEAGRRIRPI